MQVAKNPLAVGLALAQIMSTRNYRPAIVVRFTSGRPKRGRLSRERQSWRRLGHAVAACMRDAELHVVDGGHAPWIHSSDQIAAVLNRFLHER